MSATGAGGAAAEKADGVPSTVRPLAKPIPPISPRITGAEVARLFEQDRSVMVLAVVRDQTPIGLIDRLGFMSRFATRYGRDLFGNKPILRVMDREPLIADARMEVDLVGRLIFLNKPSALQTGFIVAENGCYVGIVAGVDLLQALVRSLAVANEQLRETQASLVQSEKMAALGALVAGIAHEINTPIGSALTATTAFGERARRFSDTAAGGTIRRSDIDGFVDAALRTSDYMQANIRRASDLISSFKQVAVDQTSDERRRFRLGQCLDDVLVSLQPRLRKEGVGVVFLCPGNIDMDSYPGSVAQVLTNLVMNALVHAFADRENRQIRVTVAPDGPDRITLSVADNGGGIPPDVQPRIFDPFFTTRRGVGGTGLGLHIVFNLITQRLGGTITVEDAPPSGTRFVVQLPLSAP